LFQRLFPLDAMNEDAEQAASRAAELKALAAAKSLPLEDQIADRSWKVRKQAYDYMLANVRGDSSVHASYALLLPKALADSNQGAQDVACDVLLALTEDCDDAVLAPVAADIAVNVVAHALNSRPAIVNKAKEGLLRLIEHSFSSEVVSATSKAYTHKIPKIALAAVEVTLLSLQQFGTSVIQPKEVVGPLLPLFDAKDAKIRAAAKSVIVELGRWLGADKMRANVLPKLRAAQQAELEACLAENQDSSQPPRVTRADRAKQAAVPPSPPPQHPASHVLSPPRPAAQQARASVSNSIDDDLFACEPVDVISKLPSSFWAQVKAAKWSERKDALVRLQEILGVPRANDVSGTDLVSTLKQIIHKDSNAACVAEACACVAALAKCVRKPFASAGKGIFLPLCFDKLKDKSAAVQRQALAAITAMHKYCFLLRDVTEAISAALRAPSPQAKQHILSWMQSSAAAERDSDVRRAQAALLPAVIGLSTDAVPAVRDAAVGVVAAFACAQGGMHAVSQFTNRLDVRRLKQLEVRLSHLHHLFALLHCFMIAACCCFPKCCCSHSIRLLFVARHLEVGFDSSIAATGAAAAKLKAASVCRSPVCHKKYQNFLNI
jgi:cytoskeleton-associated protein 5